MQKISRPWGIGAGQMSRVDSARIARAKRRLDAAKELKLAEPLTKGSSGRLRRLLPPLADGMLACIEARRHCGLSSPAASLRDGRK